MATYSPEIQHWPTVEFLSRTWSGLVSSWCEISVITSQGITEEKRGRSELLSMTTAYHSRSFPWSDVLNFHGTWLLEVEKGGERQWGGRESFLAVEASALYSVHTVQRVQTQGRHSLTDCVFQTEGARESERRSQVVLQMIPEWWL